MPILREGRPLISDFYTFTILDILGLWDWDQFENTKLWYIWGHFRTSAMLLGLVWWLLLVMSTVGRAPNASVITTAGLLPHHVKLATMLQFMCEHYVYFIQNTKIKTKTYTYAIQASQVDVQCSYMSSWSASSASQSMWSCSLAVNGWRLKLSFKAIVNCK